MKIKDLVPVIGDCVYVEVFYVNKDKYMAHTVDEGCIDVLRDDTLEMEVVKISTEEDFDGTKLEIQVEPPKAEGIAVQISAIIHVKNKEDYDFNFPEKIKAVLENAGYEACCVDNTAFWPEEVYFG